MTDQPFSKFAEMWPLCGEVSQAIFTVTRPVVDPIVDETGLTQPRCGADVPDEIRAWFGTVGANQKSFALAPLREENLNGLLVLASEDVKRFYPEMGTLYLTWLAELSGAAISRFL